MPRKNYRKGDYNHNWRKRYGIAGALFLWFMAIAIAANIIRYLYLQLF